VGGGPLPQRDGERRCFASPCEAVRVVQRREVVTRPPRVEPLLRAGGHPTPPASVTRGRAATPVERSRSHAGMCHQQRMGTRPPAPARTHSPTTRRVRQTVTARRVTETL
jgi:hypothetical protein